MSFKRILALVLAFTMAFSIAFPGGVAFAAEGDTVIVNGTDGDQTPADTVENESATGNGEGNQEGGDTQDKQPGTDNTVSVAVTSLTLTSESEAFKNDAGYALTLKAEETAQLSAVVAPEDATDKTVVWESDNAAVATVADGLVTAVAEGTATITATAGNVSAEVAVTVEAKGEATSETEGQSEQKDEPKRNLLGNSSDETPYVAKIGDVTYESIDAAVSAANTGETVEIVTAGSYTLPNLLKNITIEGGVKGVVFSHTSAGNIASVPNGATFKNVTFNFGNVDYHGFQHAGKIVMENCTLNGRLTSYGDMEFNNCHFYQDAPTGDYHMWVYGGGTVSYSKCDFHNSVKSKFLNLYQESSALHVVTVTDCYFENSGVSSKAALNVKANAFTDPVTTLAYNVTVVNCRTEGSFPTKETSDASFYVNSLVQIDDVVDGKYDNHIVTVDGKLVWANGAEVTPQAVVTSDENQTTVTAEIDADYFADKTDEVEFASGTDASKIAVKFDSAAVAQIKQNASNSALTLKVEDKTPTASSSKSYEITFVDDNGAAVFDAVGAAGTATVTVPYTGTATPRVYLNESGKLTEITDVTLGEGTISFTVKHFSIYDVVNPDVVASFVKAGSMLYTDSLATAFAEADDNSTIQVLAETTAEGIDVDKNLVLNLNNKTVTFGVKKYAFSISGDEKTLKIEGNGKISSTGNYKQAIQITGGGSSVEINNATIELTGSGAAGIVASDIDSGIKLENGASIIASGANGKCIQIDTGVTAGNITLIDAVLSGSGYGVYSNGPVSATLANANVTSDGTALYNFNGAWTVTNSVISGATAVWTPDGGSVNIVSGSVKGDLETTNPTKITVSGGVFSSNPSAYVVNGKTVWGNKDNTYKFKVYDTATEMATVSFDAKEGAFADDAVSSVSVPKGLSFTKAAELALEGVKVEKPVAKRDAYAFGYWFSTDESAEYDFTTEINENITLKAHWNQAAAQVNGEYFATLQEAIDAANSGDTVFVLDDLALSDPQTIDGETNQYGAVIVDKNLTIDGGNHTITSTIARAIGVKGTSANVNVTFKDLTVKNSKAGAICIITRGGIGDLVLDHVTLDTEGCPSGYNQPLTIGGTQTDTANVTVKNNSFIQTNDAATKYYAIILWNPVNLSIENSTIRGWACVYVKPHAAGTVVTIDNSTLISKGLKGSSNHFAAIVDEANNVDVTVTNTVINVTAAENTYQGIGLPSFMNDVSITLGEGNTVTLNGETAIVGFNMNIGDVAVSGGTFNVPVEPEYCADGYVPKDNGNGNYGVTPGFKIYFVNGETGEYEVQTVEKAEPLASVALKENQFAKEHYHFAGWNTDPEGEGTVYTDKQMITPDADLELYAQWEIDKFNVTFVDEDGTTVLKAAAPYDYGTPAADIVKPENPTKAPNGDKTYAFDKWVNSTDAEKTLEEVTADVTYRATYTETSNEARVKHTGDTEYTYYTSFAEAVAAANSGETVTLLKNIELTTLANIESKTGVVIDLGGYEVAWKVNNWHVNNNSTVTIRNGTIDISGNIASGDCIIGIGWYNTTANTLTLDHITLKGENYSSAYTVLYAYGNGVNTLNLNDCTVSLKGEKSESGGAFKGGSAINNKINITNSQINLDDASRGFTTCDVTVTSSTVNIENSDNGFNSSAVTIDNSTVTVKNGSGRGITAGSNPVVIKGDSVVTLSGNVEGDLRLDSGSSVSIQDTATLSPATVKENGGKAETALTVAETALAPHALVSSGNNSYVAYADLAAAFAAITADEMTVKLIGNDDSNATVSHSATLDTATYNVAGQITVANGKTLAITGSGEFANYPVKSGSGALSIKGAYFPTAIPQADCADGLASFGPVAEGEAHAGKYTVSGVVAKLGDVPYSTLAAAIAAADGGATVTVVDNTEDAVIEVAKDLTIEVGEDSNAKIMGKLVSKSGTLTITGGDFANQPEISDDGAVRISGGTFHTDSFKLYDAANNNACALALMADGCIPVVYNTEENKATTTIPTDGTEVTWTVKSGYDAINVTTRTAYASATGNNVAGVETASYNVKSNQTVIVLKDVTMYYGRNKNNYGQIHIDLYTGIVIKSMDGRKYTLTDGGRAPGGSSTYFPVKISSNSEVTFENLVLQGSNSNWKGTLNVENGSTCTIKNVDVNGRFYSVTMGNNGTQKTLNVYDSTIAGTIDNSGSLKSIEIYSGEYSQSSFGSNYTLHGGTFTGMDLETVLDHIDDSVSTHADVVVADGKLVVFERNDNVPEEYSTEFAAIIKSPDGNDGFTKVYFMSPDKAFEALKDGETLEIYNDKTVSEGVYNTNLTTLDQRFTVIHYDGGEGSSDVQGKDYTAQITPGYALIIEADDVEPGKLYKTVVNQELAQAKIVKENGDEKYYPLLTDALSAVDDKDEIVLLKDVTASSYISMSRNKTYTLNLNGHSIIGDVRSSVGLMYFSAGNVTFTGEGEVKNTSTSSSYARAIYVSGATLNIKGGTFTANLQAVYRNSGTVNVSGGYINGKSVDFYTATDLHLTGGVYSKLPTLSAVEDGYCITPYVDENNVYHYEVVPRSAVIAKIGDIYYKTLADAVNAAEDNGSIELVNSNTSVESVTVDKNLTLTSGTDADGKFYTFNGTISVAGEKKLNVTGGVFRSQTEAFPISGEGSIAIVNSYFNAEVPEAYAADNYIPKHNAETSGNYTGLYTVESGEIVARIGTVGYGTLSEALSAANAANAATTITILKDIDETLSVFDVSPHITFTSDAAVTVTVHDTTLGAHRFYFRNGATFEQNVTWDANGTVSAPSGFVTEFNGNTTINGTAKFRIFRIVGKDVTATVNETGRLICDVEVMICVYDGAKLVVNGSGSNMEEEQIHGTIKIDNDSTEDRTNTVELNNTYARLNWITVKPKAKTEYTVEDRLIFTANNSRIEVFQNNVDFGDSTNTVVTLNNSTLSQVAQGCGITLASDQTLNLDKTSSITTDTWTNNGTVRVTGLTAETVFPHTVVTVNSGAIVPGAFAPNAVEGKTFMTAVKGQNIVIAEAVAKIGTGSETQNFETLADAIAAVPTDGTETTITMIADEAVVSGVTVAAGQNIVLELNGKTISGNTDSTSTYALIRNLGTLTIQDNTDTNKDGTGTGLITTYISNPDTGDVPGYASNTITNNGTLTVKSGKIVNNGSGYACYAIDNQTNGTLYSPVLNIEGGRMVQMNAYTYAVRMFCNSTTNANTVNVSGGVIEGGYGLWLQSPNAKANNAVLNISGGTIDARDGMALFIGGTKSDRSNNSITISGGTIGGTGVGIQGPNTGTNYGHLEISDGNFAGVQAGANVVNFISGGTFVGGAPNATYIAPTKAASLYDEETDTYVIADAVACIGNAETGIGYLTLTQAINAANDGDTVKLLKNASGNGIVIPDNTFTSGLTIDLNGKTYTLDGTAVGSAGTETNGFQLKKGNKLTFQNGTINVAEGNAENGNFKRVFQSYADVTFTDVTVDGMNLKGDNAATEFCNGNVSITGNSSFTAKTGVAAINVDAWNGAYPDGAHLTVNTTGTISGIHCYTEGSGTAASSELHIEAGTVSNLTVAEGSTVTVTKANSATVTPPTGYAWTTKDAETKILAPVVAEIGEVGYASLADAIAAVGEGETITMVANETGAKGITVPSGKNFTVDFNNHTYTVSKPGAGSTGTETQAFQLLKDSTITFKNGTIGISEDNLTLAVAPAKNIKRIIQNYANLTLDNMTINAENQFGGEDYVLSFNNGASVIKDTKIITSGNDVVAFDVYLNNYYTETSVNVCGTSSITGSVEISATSEANGEKLGLTLSGGSLSGAIKMDSHADKATIVKDNNFDQAPPAGYAWTKNDENTQILAPAVASVKHGDTTTPFASLAEAVAAAQPGDTVTLLGDVTLTATQEIAKDLTLDLNGHNITANGKRALHIKSGDVSIVDNSTGETKGTISSMHTEGDGLSSGSSVIRVGDSGEAKAKLTIGAGVTIDAPFTYGVTVFGTNTNGVELIVNGKIIANGTEAAISGNGNGGNKGAVTVNAGAVITSAVEAIYHPQGDKLTITGGEITGTTAVYVKSGTVEITGGTLTGNGAAVPYNPTGDDCVPTGDALVVDSCKYPGGAPNVTISGSPIFESTNNKQIGYYEYAKEGEKDPGTVTATSNTISVTPGYTWLGDQSPYTLGKATFALTVTSSGNGTVTGASVAPVSGGGNFAFDTVHTVTATQVKGYTFRGWYRPDGSLVNENLSFEYTIGLENKLIAVFSASGSTFRLQVTGSRFTIDGGTIQRQRFDDLYSANEDIELNFVGVNGEHFLYWVNSMGKILSTSPVYSFPLVMDSEIQAVTSDAEAGTEALVVFCTSEHNGQVLSQRYYGKNETIVPPAAPASMGKTFTGWSLTTEEIQSLMATQTRIVVYPVYESEGKKYQVTVKFVDKNGTTVHDPLTTDEEAIGKGQILQAPQIENYVFLYWTDEQGTILAYTAAYAVRPSENIILRAVYGTETIDQVPTVLMTSAFGRDGRIYFQATRSIPDGYAIVKVGILCAGVDRVGVNPAELANVLRVDGNNSYVGDYPFTATTLNDTGTLYFTPSDQSRQYVARGYVILKNLETNEILHVYSNNALYGSYIQLQAGSVEQVSIP